MSNLINEKGNETGHPEQFDMDLYYKAQLENNVGICFKKSYDQLERENEQLKVQISKLKEDVERQRNIERGLLHDYTVSVLNELLDKWRLKR